MEDQIHIFRKYFNCGESIVDISKGMQGEGKAEKDRGKNTELTVRIKISLREIRVRWQKS